MLATGTHVLIRVKSDIRLPRIGPFAADGSYLARVSGGGTTLTMRVIEYHVEPGRGDHARAVLPGHRPARPRHPSRPPTRGGLPVAVGRLRNRAARGQIGHPRRRPGHRGDPALGHPGADPPRARRLDHRHRSRPRRHPLGRRHRRTVPEGPPHRPTGRSPAPVVHHRPPHPDRHRAAGTATASLPAPARAAAHQARPGRDRHRPGHHRPTSSPRPQAQNQAGVSSCPARHHHPHRPRPRARLRHRGLTRHRRVPRAGHHPGHGTRRTRPDSRAAAMRPASRHSPYITSKITTGVRRSANYLISLALARRGSCSGGLRSTRRSARTALRRRGGSGRRGREDSDDVGAAADFFVEPFDGVVRRRRQRPYGASMGVPAGASLRVSVLVSASARRALDGVVAR